MPAASKHAEFSPSKRHRWMVCGASIYLERKLRAELPEPVADDLFNGSSIYADEGTYAGLIAEMALKEDKDVEAYAGLQSECGRFFVGPGESKGEITISLLQMYVDEVRRHEKRLGAKAKVEVRRDSPFEKFDTGGTPDASVACSWGTELVVLDLKWGAGTLVEAINNEQLLGYMINEQHAGTEFEKATAIIVQPRHHSNPKIKTWEVTPEQIEQAKLDTLAQLVVIDSGKANYVPEVKACQWCFKSYCPKLKEDSTKAADTARGTAQGMLTPIADWSLEWLEQEAEKVETLKLYAHDVEAELKRRLVTGEHSERWALEQGTAKRVVQATESQVVRAANKHGFKKADVFEKPKMKSPAQLEKLSVEFKQYANEHDFFKAPPGGIKLVRRAAVKNEYIPKPDPAKTELTEIDD